MRCLSNIILFIALISMAACGPQTMYLEVEVQDVLSGENLDSAIVEVYRNARGGQEQIVQTCISNPEGLCRLQLEVDEQYAYRVEVKRRHFDKALSDDGSSYLHQSKLEITDSSQVTLFLKSILPPDPERYEKMYPVVPISQVIAAISADEWEWAFLPKINWEDVPILLKQEPDTNFIHQYPRNLRSRYKPDSIRAGLVSLWLIEALRKQQLRSNDTYYSLVPPSRAPVLGTRRGNPSGYNSIEQVNTAHQAYTEWWDQVPADSIARIEAIRKNPLAGKGLSWM